jgi:hypothetical protein
MLWVRISIRARSTTLCDKVCQWLATGRWFSQSAPVSSTYKIDRHDITEIVLKVALNVIKQTNKNNIHYLFCHAHVINKLTTFLPQIRFSNRYVQLSFRIRQSWYICHKVRDCRDCLTPSQQSLSAINDTNRLQLRRWCCMLSTRSTLLVGFLHSVIALKQ